MVIFTLLSRSVQQPNFTHPSKMSQNLKALLLILFNTCEFKLQSVLLTFAEFGFLHVLRPTLSVFMDVECLVGENFDAAVDIFQYNCLDK